MIIENGVGCVVFGTHIEIVQHMLDYDYLCGKEPSVKAILSFGPKRSFKVFYGDTEYLLHTIQTRDELKQLNNATVLINLASSRSAPDVTMQAMKSGFVSHVIIIAEGIPERQTRQIRAEQQRIQEQENRFVAILGPATVGGIFAGRLRIGHTGGSLDNIIASKLYRQGSVGFVSKSGGMTNEMCRVIAKHTDGVHTAIAIGGDRFPLMTFEEVVLSYEHNKDIKMIVLLGEVGNDSECRVADMLIRGDITKPLVARVTGTSAQYLTSDIQFGHAGAKANSETETASYKNEYLVAAGAHVPDSFATLGLLIGDVFLQEVASQHKHTSHAISQTILDKKNIIEHRRPTRFSSSISDERGEELLYNGHPIKDIVKKNSLANVIGQLWLKKTLPDYALRFVDTVLILLADHGPAVSGATNTIITSRAGKDVVSSLIAGLATIGPRFGGAITGAGTCFLEAVHTSESAIDFVKSINAQGGYIPGIGHKVKSIYNPDSRCEILADIQKTFPISTHYDFAKEVESITTSKKPNLILNVDGTIAAMMLDMFVSLDMSHQDIKDFVKHDGLNAFFVLSRSIGLIGHHLDQKRLNEGLYRTERDDILYL